MSAQTAIRDRLCELCGIAPDYVDIWGNRHPVSDKTKLALLAAMGMRVHTEAELQQSLSSLENSQWCRVLPPVHVMREGEQQFRITVTFPVGHEQEECNWAVIQESGQRLEGSFRPVELEVLENREIGDLQLVRYGFSLPAIPTTGYHRFELRTETALWGANRATMSLIVAPGTCFKPDALMGEGRVWGPSVQLYAVRSQHNWGVGDLGDLRALLEFCAEQGAGIVGVSPLHALFPDNP